MYVYVLHLVKQSIAKKSQWNIWWNISHKTAYHVTFDEMYYERFDKFHVTVEKPIITKFIKCNVSFDKNYLYLNNQDAKLHFDLMRNYQYNIIDMKTLIKHHQTNWIVCNIWHKLSLSNTLKD